MFGITLTFGLVEEVTVLDDQTEIVLERVQAVILVSVDLFPHRREVHGMSDELVVRGNLHALLTASLGERVALTSASSTG